MVSAASAIGANRERQTMIKTILVPTDGSEHANKAVELAADIAGKYGAKVIILHALQRHASADELKAQVAGTRVRAELAKRIDELCQATMNAAAAAFQGYPAPVPIPEEVVKEVGQLILDKARQAVEAKGVTDITVEVIDGAAADSIIAAAKHQKADMIVMGSRGLSNLGGLLMGSVSHKVSHLAPCTCVTVK